MEPASHNSLPPQWPGRAREGAGPTRPIVEDQVSDLVRQMGALCLDLNRLLVGGGVSMDPLKGSSDRHLETFVYGVTSGDTGGTSVRTSKQ